MGNGASSKNGKDQKKDQDLGDEDQEEDFDSYARKKAQENRSGQQRLEQAGLLPKLESTPERSKPVVRETIIGLDDSDDDEGKYFLSYFSGKIREIISFIFSYKTEEKYYKIQTSK